MKCLTYKALVRPNLIYGIPREFFYVAGFCSIIVWIASNNILFGILSMIVWLPMGYIWAKVDPDFMGIYLSKYITIKPNHSLEKNQYPEYVIPGLVIITTLVFSSLTVGVISLMLWIPLYVRFSNQSNEYQA